MEWKTLTCPCLRKKVTKEINQTDNFTYRSSFSWIEAVSHVANLVINHSEFKKRVEQIEKFDYTDDNGKQVFEKLIQTKCVLRTYKSKNPWSKAIATTYRNNKIDIYFNTRRNPRSIELMVNTAIHELLHNAGYGHGDNSPTGKENSVNYKVGAIASIVYTFYIQNPIALDSYNKF